MPFITQQPPLDETPACAPSPPVGGFSPFPWLAAGLLFLLALATQPDDEEIDEQPGRANPKPIVTDQQIQEWLRVWQKRLRLENWNVRARMARVWELGPNLADIDIRPEKRRAAIRILNPRDYDLPRNEIPADIELSIVHELTHLQLAALPLPEDRSADKAEERVVQKLSRALVRNPPAAKAPRKAGELKPPAARFKSR